MMTAGSPQPRIGPLGTASLDDERRSLLAKVRQPGASGSNVFLTLVRNPALFRRFIAYGGQLMYGRLPERLRELAVLRVALRCGADYEWRQHVAVALGIGVSEAEIAAIAGDVAHSGWSEVEAAVLRTVDELHDRAIVNDHTWETLARELDDGILVELMLLIGHFHGVAYFLNALRVPLDSELERLPAIPTWTS